MTRSIGPDVRPNLPIRVRYGSILLIFETGTPPHHRAVAQDSDMEIRSLGKFICFIDIQLLYSPRSQLRPLMLLVLWFVANWEYVFAPNI